MRIFVYEYTCATSDASGARALCAEGAAMLRAVIDDLAALPGVQVVTLFGLNYAQPVKAECVRCGSTHEESCFRRLTAGADWSLVVAPEFDDLLLRRCTWVLEAGGRLLGPSPNAIALTADKRELATYLSGRGIPTPATSVHDDPAPCVRVCKPRFGAGAQATYLVPANAPPQAVIERARAHMPGAEFVLQPYVPGTAASVAFLIGPRGVVALEPARQCLRIENRIHYAGGELPLPAGLRERAIELGQRAVATVPGLFGYVGVDLVLRDVAREDYVIEINPRLTTSYIGLRRLAGFNVAGEMLRIADGGEAAPLIWRSARVKFDKDGTVEES
jgi:tyramine---L-glutamate ligase